MAAPIRPASTKAFGREKWLWVPAIASIGAMTVAEASAATGLDISCYLFEESNRPTQTTNVVQRMMRVCDTIQYGQIGITTYAGGEMIASVDPQAAALSNGKKAWEKFPEGTLGFLVRRLGIIVDTDLAAGQFYDAFPVEFGPPFPYTVGDGETKEVAFTSSFAITGPPAFIKPIVA